MTMSPKPLDKLFEVTSRLRGRDGCPWVRARTHQSLAPHILEEVYELVDAVQRGDSEALRGELGDLLFLVALHAAIAEDAGAFDFDAVVVGVTDKLIRRHPAVFGGSAAGEDAVVAEQCPEWEDRKAAESAADGSRGAPANEELGVAAALPALTRAVKLQNRAARDGFDWPDRERVLDKLEEEIAELRDELPGDDPARLEHEVGDVLLATTNLARHLGIDPEAALRHANHRFEQRYARMEQLAAANGLDLAAAGLDEMEALWQQAKRELGKD